MHLLIPGLLASIAFAFATALVSLMLNGTWRAVRRRLRWHKKISLEPDAFIANLCLYLPPTLAVKSLEEPFGGDSARATAYRMSFATTVNRMLVRFETVFDASIVPSDSSRTLMLMSRIDGRECPTWDGLPSTVKAIVRLLDNARIGKYHGPATAFSDSYHRYSVERPAAVIASEPTEHTPDGAPLTKQTISQRLFGRNRQNKISA